MVKLQRPTFQTTGVNIDEIETAIQQVEAILEGNIETENFFNKSFSTITNGTVIDLASEQNPIASDKFIGHSNNLTPLEYLTTFSDRIKTNQRLKTVTLQTEFVYNNNDATYGTKSFHRVLTTDVPLNYVKPFGVINSFISPINFDATQNLLYLRTFMIDNQDKKRYNIFEECSLKDGKLDVAVTLDLKDPDKDSVFVATIMYEFLFMEIL